MFSIFLFQEFNVLDAVGLIHFRPHYGVYRRTG